MICVIDVRHVQRELQLTPEKNERYWSYKRENEKKYILFLFFFMSMNQILFPFSGEFSWKDQTHNYHMERRTIEKKQYLQIDLLDLLIRLREMI